MQSDLRGLQFIIENLLLKKNEVFHFKSIIVNIDYQISLQRRVNHLYFKFLNDSNIRLDNI